MILCPNCLHKELVGALFCSECGAQLIFPDGVPTGNIRTTSHLKRVGGKETIEAMPEPPPMTISDALVSLNIVSSGDVIPIRGQDEVTVGRVSEGQPVIPDIDLTPYKAYESGVSRMHASIRVGEDLVVVTDLGSANGTRINGRRINANVPQPIKHGDILTLGKFKIQVLIRSK